MKEPTKVEQGCGACSALGGLIVFGSVSGKPSFRLGFKRAALVRSSTGGFADACINQTPQFRVCLCDTAHTDGWEDSVEPVNIRRSLDVSVARGLVVPLPLTEVDETVIAETISRCDAVTE
jgi:hypothetical protein